MRLFLSSQDLGHHADIAYEMCGPRKRVAFIANAGDEHDQEYRNEKSARKKTMFEAAGFDFEEVDLRDYFGKSAELAEKLKDFDMVWCNGGNTFILRRAMRASGLDDLLKQRLADDSIMYGGSSAGSCICAPSLHGIDRGDRPDPDTVPAEYPIKEIIWEGLNLVPFMIVPHCDQEWFRTAADESIKALKIDGTPHQLLNDGEVVIVNNEELRVLRPDHEKTRYVPVTQKPYCCVPTCLQMVLEKNRLPRLNQEEIGTKLGLVVPPEFADEFENVAVGETPVVASGFGTRIQDPDYSLEKLITSMSWPFTFKKILASSLETSASLEQVLSEIEVKNGDALLCYQNDKGYGHVVVFDRLEDGIQIVDPSPQHHKWRTISVEDMFTRIKKHGDSNSGGVWFLERV